MLLPTDALTRRLATATLVNTFGNGLFFAISALFFTRVVGLSVAQVGLGLTVAGACGVAAGVPFGRLADRYGAKPVFVTSAVLEAAGLCTYPLVDSMATFLPVVCMVQVVDRGGSAVRSAIIATAVPAERRATTRAYLRAVTNVGIGAGAACGALALHADTRGAYVTMVLLNALTFLGTAAIMLGLPGSAAPANTAPVRTRRALADRPYLALTALNGVLAIQFTILEVGLPLWVVGHTHAPRLVVAAALLINTVFVVLFQVRAAHAATTPDAAARAALRSGVLLLVSCVLFGAAHGVDALAATVLVVVGTVVGAAGETISSAAGWTLSYDLADQTAPGLYQGVFQTGTSVGAMVAPIVITSTAIHLGLAGWTLLGALFLLAGAGLIPVTRWALAAREPATVH